MYQERSIIKRNAFDYIQNPLTPNISIQLFFNDIKCLIYDFEIHNLEYYIEHLNKHHKTNPKTK